MVPLPALESPWSDEALAPLDEVVGDARIVALAELHHQSGGIAEAQARLARHLVAHDGFRVLLVETPWIAAEAAGDAVARGVDAAPSLRSGVFAPFQDAALADLLTWMGDWNRAHPDDPVRFGGFDQQQTEDDTLRLATLLADRAPEVAAALGPCSDPRGPDRPCFSALDAADARLAGAGWPGAVEARRCAAGLRSAQVARGRASLLARDRGLADVIVNRVEEEHPGARVLLVGHAGHLMHHADEVRRFGPTAGDHLTARYGDGYAVVGITAGDTSVTPYLLRPPDVEDLGPDWLEAALHPVAGRTQWRLGIFPPLEVPRQFDALLYLDVAGPQRALAWAGLPAALVGWAPDRTARYGRIEGQDRATAAAAARTWLEARGDTLAATSDDGRTTRQSWAWPLDARTAELAFTDADGGVDLEVPGVAGSLVAVRAAGEDAVVLDGHVSADGATLALDDGSLPLPPGVFPAAWGGLRARVTCRVVGEHVGPCRSTTLAFER